MRARSSPIPPDAPVTSAVLFSTGMELLSLRGPVCAAHERGERGGELSLEVDVKDAERRVLFDDLSYGRRAVGHLPEPGDERSHVEEQPRAVPSLERWQPPFERLAGREEPIAQPLLEGADRLGVD